MDKVVGKIIVLREICENKNVLFGPFGADITSQRKIEIWTKILNKAKSLGLVSYDKNHVYMRDVYWQNLKRCALAKKNKKVNDKYSPINDLVFEILEKPTALDPPVTKEAEPTTMKQEDEDYFNSNDVLDTTKHEEDSNDNPNIVYLEAAETTSPVCKKRTRMNKTKILKNCDKISKRKMALEVEFMELQNYKLKLEVLEMEQKLGVKPSKFTKEIARKIKESKTDNRNCNGNDDSDTELDYGET